MQRSGTGDSRTQTKPVNRLRCNQKEPRVAQPANPAHPWHQSRAERYSIGKALRAKTPREAHGGYVVTDKRDPVAILAEADDGRIAALLPIRYQRMGVSAFTFLRGSAAVMATDLVAAPRAGIAVQSCGDCHLMNFGAFLTPEGNVLFDINDFDETLPNVDFTVDLKRLTASVAVAALDAGVSEKKARAVAKSAAAAYREQIAKLAILAPLDVWHTRMVLEHEMGEFDNGNLRRQILGALAHAQEDIAADDNFPKLVSAKGGDLRIADRPPLIYHFDHAPDARERIDAAAVFEAYLETLPPERRVLVQRYQLADVAFKVVGVGSVGTFCAVGLFVSGDAEPLFLQIKEARPSVLERISRPQPAIAHQGRRVVEGQRIMQAASDIFLGWARDPETERRFYVRHLKNRRLGSLGDVIRGNALAAYAALCGRTLARAHARSGDTAVLAGYMGKSEAMDDAMAGFAMRYAEQTTQDYARLMAARPMTPAEPPKKGAKKDDRKDDRKGAQAKASKDRKTAPA